MRVRKQPWTSGFDTVGQKNANGKPSS